MALRGFGWKLFGAFALIIIPLAMALAAAHSAAAFDERRLAILAAFRPAASSITPEGAAGAIARLQSAVMLEAEFIPSGAQAGDPVLAAALAGEEAAEYRFSNLLKKNAWFVAYPVRKEGSVAGALHFIVDAGAAEAAGRSNILLAAALALVAAAAASYLIARALSRRLRSLSDYLEGMVGGALVRGAGHRFDDDLDRVGAKATSIAGQVTETLGMLREEREKVRTIIEYMEDGVVLLDAAGTIVLHNAAFTNLFGLSASLDGKRLAEVVRHPALLDLVALHTATGKSVKREMTAGAAVRRHILVSAVPLSGDAGAARTLLMIYDISGQKKLEEMRVDFVANASHELRTPLTAIRGYVETMADGAVDDPDTARHMLGIIQRQSERLARLIDDLLALSNIELEREKFEFKPVEPDPLLKGAVQMFIPAAAQRRIGVSCVVEGGTPAFEADKDRLMQIMINLLDNAIKYTPDGGRVEARCRPLTVSRANAAGFDYPSLDGNPLLPEAEEEWERRFVEIAVSDTGEGIPAHAIPRLMERFYRVDRDRSRERGGTGLGLSIVKHIVIAHHGSIKVESVLGQGTLVRFIVPVSHNIG